MSVSVRVGPGSLNPSLRLGGGVHGDNLKVPWLGVEWSPIARWGIRCGDITRLGAGVELKF
jgi:hypothetical protein